MRHMRIPAIAAGDESRSVTSVKVVYVASSGLTDYAACFFGAGRIFCSGSSSRFMVM